MSKKKMTKEIDRLIDENKVDEAFVKLASMLLVDPNNIDNLLIRGKLYYKCQKFGEALNDFNKILLINEEHEVAMSYKAMIMNILDFWHKDSHNP